MRSSQRGLSMLELVFAFGLFFLASSFLMSTFAFGSRLPIHAQRNSDTASVAQELLDERLSQPLTVPIVAEPRAPAPGHPEYEFEVAVLPSSFDPLVSVVSLTVYPTAGQGNPMNLRGLRPPNPVPLGESLATTTYDCFSCHSAAGRPELGAGGLAPEFDPSALAASAAAAGFGGDIEGYIRESVRDPEAYESTGWVAAMQGFPNITSMPDEDLDALVNFITNL